jgi:hypothetical protein
MARQSIEECHGATLLPFPPRPRRIEVRISATDGRAPIGRTRPLTLRESDFERLIEAAERLEGRA